MKQINEAQVLAKWSPMIEQATGLTDKTRLNWISKYAHFHAMNEAAMGGVNTPYSTLYNVPGVGNAMPSQSAGMTGAQQTGNNTLGSGDKWPGLLPMSLQVAARTVGFDLVNVTPMSGPTGQIAYMDYVYAGGKGIYGAPGQYDENGKPKINPANAASKMEAPFVFTVAVKVGEGVTGSEGVTDSAALANATALFKGLKSGDFVSFKGDKVTLHAVYVSKSRIDGYPIFRRVEFTGTSSNNIVESNLADVFNDINIEVSVKGKDASGVEIDKLVKIGETGNYPSMVSTLEDQIQGYTGSGSDDSDPWGGTWIDGTRMYEPMDRGTGEITYARPLGLQVFAKLVQVGTYSVSVNVTQEQIQDLNSQWGIDVLSMVENAGINEISQSINKHITSRLFGLGWKNHIMAERAERINLNLDTTTVSTPTQRTIAYAYAEDGVQKNASMEFKPISFGPSTTASLTNQDVIIKAVMAQILAAGNIITQRGRRGPANFVVTNAKVATALQSNAQYSFSPIENTFNQTNGQLYPVGTMAGMTVYVDPNMEYHDTRVLVGRKGQVDEPGVVFCPYLMADSIKMIPEGTMAPKVVIKSRYALVDAGFHPETMYISFVINMSDGMII